MQESFALATEEQNEMLGEILGFTKHIHSEWQKASLELAKLSEMQNELDEMKKLLQKEKEEPVLSAK
ncbi:hypothetical protein V7087_28100 [Neobacillus niacini]|uniref:hypothetical protein n=1 Tax=Neobacillus niacini TaxID=86668 RepID=UPI002FFDE54C